MNINREILESSRQILRNPTTGSLLDDGYSKLQTEEFFDSIIQEDESNIELNLKMTQEIIFEPSEESTQIIGEDDHDVFNIVLRKMVILSNRTRKEYEYILFENDDRLMGIDRSVILLMTLETVEFVERYQCQSN